MLRCFRVGSSDATTSGSGSKDILGSYLLFLRAFSKLLSSKHLLLLRLPRKAKRLRTSGALRTKVDMKMMVMMVMDQQESSVPS